MATLRVRVEDFEDGVYPDVCSSSGVEGGTRLYRADATYRPGWVWLLLLGGPPGFVVAVVLSIVLRRSVPGYVPYAPSVQAAVLRRRNRFAQGFVVALAVFAGSLALSMSSRGGTGLSGLAALGFVFGGLGLTITLFFWCYPPGSVGAKLQSNGRWVGLEPVSNAFAFAFEQQESRRRAARRAESAIDRTVW